MDTLSPIQVLARIGKILSMIVFVFSIVGLASSALGIVCYRMVKDVTISVGDVTLHGILSDELGLSEATLHATLAASAIACAGEAVIAKFAHVYFKNELKAGTPFTAKGAGELLRLGVITVAVSLGCFLLAVIAAAIIIEIMDPNAVMPNNTDSGSSSIGLGITFIIASLLCRHGASLSEAKPQDDAESHE